MVDEPIKIVFWDLDGTLWPGTLDEDAQDMLAPHKTARTLLKTLDERGILNCVISQAAASAALAHLKQCGLEQYFINSKFGIGSKAQAIAGALQELNLLARNAAFIDDLPFFRAEVESMLPEVLTLAPDRLEGIAALPRFNVRSSLGANRRELYRVEAERNMALANFAGSRAAFLKSCDMRLYCEEADRRDTMRVKELYQRTHRLSTQPDVQMTESQEYPRNIVDYIARLQDRFGDYGLIAAATLNWHEVMVNNQPYISCLRLAVSCRVQGRGVLEAFLFWLTTKAQGAGKSMIIPVSTRSDVNKALRQSLRFSGFAAVDRDNEYEWLTLAHPQRLQVPEWLKLQDAGYNPLE